MRGTIAAVLLSLAAAPVFAQAPEALRVAVIDVQRIVEESAVGKEARSRLAKLNEEKRAQIARSQEEIDGLRKQLSTQRATLTEAKVAELAKSIEDKQVALQRAAEDAQAQLAEAQRKEMETLEQQVMPLINELGREMKLQMIFNKFQSGLVYADDTVDITDQVLRRFNTRVTQ